MSDEVVVVGDLMVDVVVVPDGPLQHGSDTPSAIRTIGGGSAANTACWLAAAGRTVRLVAAVGDDAAGRIALADLEATGVEFAGTVEPQRPTGTCVALVDATGERTMLPDRGANDALSPTAVERALGRASGWVHVSGYALLGPGSHPAAATAAAITTPARHPVVGRRLERGAAACRQALAVPRVGGRVPGPVRQRRRAPRPRWRGGRADPRA